MLVKLPHVNELKEYWLRKLLGFHVKRRYVKEALLQFTNV